MDYNENVLIYGFSAIDIFGESKELCGEVTECFGYPMAFFRGELAGFPVYYIPVELLGEPSLRAPEIL